VVALSDEPSCSDSEPGDTCDGECRCESCWDPEPTDAEVIADLRAKLKMRDVQLQQQNEQCQILLAKLAEVKALERDLTSERNVANNLRDQLRRRMKNLAELETALSAALKDGRDLIVEGLNKRVEQLELEVAKRVPCDTPGSGCFTASIGEDGGFGVSLWYPRVFERNAGLTPTIGIGLVDVRASDGISVWYDFDRDGWVIMQEPGKAHASYVEDTGPPQEVAFVKSWALVEDADEVPST
jgi:hypothetical protein